MVKHLVMIAMMLLASAITHAQKKKPPDERKDEKRPERFTQKFEGFTAQFEMVRIKGGKFKLSAAKEGEEAKEVEVKDFYIGKTEVPWEVFDIWCQRLDLKAAGNVRNADADARPSQVRGLHDAGMGHEGYAAQNMTFHSATKFCEWLSRMTGRKYRLPTEIEWQYACRAGDEAAAPTLQALEKLAWAKDNAKEKTQPIGKLEPNAWGLHDMLGNVSEWTVRPDGTGILRGGNYRTPRDRLKYTSRNIDPPAPDPGLWWFVHAPHVGFRVIMEE